MGYWGESHENLARLAEQRGDWKTAKGYWLLAGRNQDANACDRIIEAVRLGDKYRALVGNAQERWENHEINNAELYEIERKAHDEVYGKK